MAEYLENSWEPFKSELNVRTAEVNDHHNAFTMLYKVRLAKNKSVQVYTMRLYALVNDAFTKVYKAVVESQLAGFFIDGLYHDFFCMKVMRENPKIFQAAVQSVLAEQILWKRFQLQSDKDDIVRGRTEEVMEIDHTGPHRKCFLCQKGGHLAKH